MNLQKQKEPRRYVPTTEAHCLEHASSWVEINSAAFEHNIAQYRAVLGPNKQLAVVIKSNAYGHGMAEIAQLCEQLPAVDWLCTVSLSEALAVRARGITKPIFVLSYLDADLTYAVEQGIDLVVYDRQTVEALETIAAKLHMPAYVHLKVDTGLSRLGLAPQAALDLVLAAQQLTHVHVRGIFTHLAESEKSGEGFTKQQIAALHAVVSTLAERGISIPFIHFSCTAALTVVEDSRYSFGRLGLGVYGLWPSQAAKQVTCERCPGFTLEQVMTWKTRVIQVKQVPTGSYIGYGRTFCTQRETVLAVLPVGYWEGYARGLSNRGQVLVNGVIAPVVGRVSMNLTTIDVTDVPNITVGSVVTLLGDHPALSPDTLAATLGTINWEIVTRINPLVPRVLI
jgi:alanine racemase